MKLPLYKDKIRVVGAKEHNLKNISVEIPRNTLTVITGLSGSGKSSLAFDTIYAEGQRRYVESLSSYARQFLGLMEKPNVELIEGLSPAISIEQKTTHKNPRSTVATVTEIYDYLRLLYARIGIVHCYQCHQKIQSQTVQEIVDDILSLPEGTKIMILAPLVRGKKGEHRKLLEDAQKEGFVRVRIDGEDFRLEDDISLNKNQKHTIEIVVERLVVKKDIKQRLTDAVELSLGKANGLVERLQVESKEKKLYSQHYGCVDCQIYYDEIEPRSFSFNSPFGACITCDGLGLITDVVESSVVKEPEKSINDGCFLMFDSKNRNWYYKQVRTVCKKLGISMDEPWKQLDSIHKTVILKGSKEKFSFKFGKGISYSASFEGVINNLRRRFKETESSRAREHISQYMDTQTCNDCKGLRLRKESLAVLIGGKNIHEYCYLNIQSALQFVGELKLTANQQKIAEQVIKEIKSRLTFLNSVGLPYLTLNRTAGTLSGGEAQRIRLATQIGSQLCGVLYILDEPSIGLHQRDNTRLLEALIRLRDLGNTVIVVEHDRETIEKSDFVIDIGPRAGAHGGQVVAADKPSKIVKYPKSLTGQYIAYKKEIPLPKNYRKGTGEILEIKKASGNNLQNITVKFPLGKFITVTGVSGSGKSTLINQTLYPILAQHFYRSKITPLLYQSIKGLEYIDKVINIDQSPIGRTPRSNPATYTGLFSPIRDLFTSLKESKIRGYKVGRFSFNVKGGRCENCEGDGVKKVEMHFLPDVYITCEVCQGSRYNRETLEINYKGHNISDVLSMSVEEALALFENIPKIQIKLQTLMDVGLSYIKLGQAATTLSGGEAQRVKLATELSKRGTGKTFYILDEPTTGLHFEDVRILLLVLEKLVDKGNTILVIEHNLDVIKTADHIIDIGPEGGDLGGKVIVTGTPHQVAKCKDSYTGHYLKLELMSNLKSKKQ